MKVVVCMFCVHIYACVHVLVFACVCVIETGVARHDTGTSQHQK